MNGSDLKEMLWPPTGLIYDQEFMLPAFCKPKLIPLKSVTLEKLEKMQQEALAKLKELERQAADPDTTRQQSQTSQQPGKSSTTDIWQADEGN